MKFSSFSKTEQGLQILLYNETAIENVSRITYYSDNASGLFSKKEFRWSFNKIYWSGWQSLNQSAVSNIDLHGSYYLFLQIRYTLKTESSGTVSSFVLNYTSDKSKENITNPPTIYDYRINASTVTLTPVYDSPLYDYYQKTIINYIIDACTLNGYSGAWYLNRSHHTGTQPISSITGLQAALSNFTNVTLEYVDGSLVTRDAIVASLIAVGNASIGYLDSSLKQIYPLVFKINSSLGQYATNASDGLAFASNASLGILTLKVNYIDACLGSVSLLTYALNVSINLYATNASINLALNNYLKESSLNLSKFKWDSGLLEPSVLGGGTGDVTKEYVDGSIGQYIKSSSTGTGLYWVNGLLDVSIEIGTGDVTKAYVDGSIANFATNTSVNSSFLTNVSLGLVTTYDLTPYATNISVGLAFASNASLGILTDKVNYIDACLGPVSSLTYALNSSMGSGLGDYATNASVGLAFASNASLGILTSKVNYIDACLGPVSSLTYALNSSLGSGLGDYATNASVNLALLTNASLGSAIQGASNVGDGSAGVFKQVSGTTLQFRKITGSGAAIVTESTDVITIGLDASFSGEVNSGVNLGSGTTIYDQKVGNNLQFKSLKSSAGTIYYTYDASQVYIDVSDYVSKTYIDGSIINFATNVSVNTALTAYATNASVNSAFLTNASLGAVQTYDLTPYATNVSVNTALTSYATNVSVGLTFASNVSLGILTSKVNYIDACLGPVSSLTYALNTSMGPGLGAYATNASVNTTLTAYATNTSVNSALIVYATNTSVNLAFLTNASLGLVATYDLTPYATNASVNLAFLTNSSLGILTSKVNYIDACLGPISILTYALNSSMGSGLGAYATNASVNLALTSYSTNASVNSALIIYATNSSIGLALNNYIKNSSLNESKFKWVDGYLEPSIYSSDVTKAYVDGSIANFATNASVNLAISNAFLTNASLGSAIQGASNVGDGSAGVFKQVSGTTLQFRKLTGSGAAVVTEGTDVITIGLDASFAGEVNTASNLGSGYGLYAEKVGDDLQFKSIKSSNNSLAFSTDASHVYIDASLDYYTKAYIDGSITNIRDTYATNASVNLALTAYATNVSVNSALTAYATNASVNLAFLTNASLGVVQTYDLTLYATNVSVNLAFASNASLGNVSTLTYAHNTSIGILTTQLSKTDTSLYNVSLLTSALNTSMGPGLGAYATNASVNLALTAYATNVSVNSALTPYATNASVNLALTAYATNTSVGLAFASNASLGILTSKVNYIDACLGPVSSLTYALNTSTGLLTSQNSLQDTSIAELSQYWVDINRFGFVDRNDTSLIFDASTYVVSLVKIGGATEWEYFRSGVKYSITNDVSVQLSIPSPSTGTYYIYIDDNIGSLTSSTTSWTLQDTKVPVTIIKFDASTNPIYQMQEERHECEIDREMHWYLHFTRGTFLVSGATLTGPSLTTATNAGVTYGISETVIADEDLREILLALNRPDGSSGAYTIEYRTSSTTWTWQSDASVPYRYSSGGYIHWDNNGSMTQGTASRYYNTYLLLTSIYGQARYLNIHGRGEFSSVASAQTEDVRSFDFTGFGIAESIIAYQFTWGTSNSYGNLGKCRLETAPKRINIATVTTVGTAAGYDHNTLANLQGGIAGEYYHLTSSQYSDYVGKTYVDGSISTAFSTNASLGILTSKVNYIDACLGPVSSLTYALNSSMGSGLGDYATNSSVNLAFLTNTSLGILTSKVNYIDACLGPVSSLTYALNTSMGPGLGAYATNVSVGLALTAYATNTSVNLAFLTNPSLGSSTDLTNYINDASLNQSKFKWDNGLLEPSVAGTADVTKEYIDGSIANFATNASVNLAFASNSSLGILTSKVNYIDACLGPVSSLTYALNSSMGSGLGDYATNASVNLAFLTNTSLGILTSKVNYIEVSVGKIEASINNTFLLSSYVNTSNYYDGSLNNIRSLYATNVSVNSALTAYSTNASVNSALTAYATNSSVNLALTVYATNASVNSALLTNASLGAIQTYDLTEYLKDASLSESKFKWVDGLLEPSLATEGASLEYVDGSLNDIRNTYATNASVNLAFLTNPSLGSSTDLTNYINDASLNQSKFKWDSGLLEPSVAGTADVTKEYVDGSIANFATNASVNLAFLTNASLGNLTALTNSFNTSIGIIEASLNDYVDAYGIFIPEASLNDSYFKWSGAYLEVSIADFTTNTSINATLTAYATNVSVNTALTAYATNVSVNTALTAYATNVSVNLAFLTNVSLGNLSVSVKSINTSIGLIEASINDVMMLSSYVNTSEYYDGSLNNIRSSFYSNASLGYVTTLTTQLGKTDTSLYNVSLLTSSNNSSIGILTTQLGKTDTSLYNVSLLTSSNNSSIGVLTTRLGKTDASLFSLTSYVDACLGDYVDISTLFYSKTQIDASFATNASVNLAFLTNPSLGAIQTYDLTEYLKDASLSESKFKWVDGLLEPSLATEGASVEYVDGSLNDIRDTFATNVSINLTFASNVSLGLVFDQYSNVSLGYVTTLTTQLGKTDTSLYIVNSLVNSNNSSIGVLTTQLGKTDASLYTVKTLQTAINTSVGILTTQLGKTDTSLYTVTTLQAAVNTSIGWLDASVKYVYNRLTVNASQATDTNAMGIITRFTAAATVAFGDVGYVNSAGSISIAKADASLTSNAIAMCADAAGISANAAGNWLLYGTARQNTWAWTTGGLIYLSTTGTTTNTLTQTMPSGTDHIIQILGVATQPDSMIFMPSLVQVEHT